MFKIKKTVKAIYKQIIIAAIIASIILAPGILLAAYPVLQVYQGGTGNGYFENGSFLIGNGSGKIATTTQQNHLYLTVCSATASSSCDYTTDGTADDVEINQALLVASSTGGAHIFLPDKHYYVDDTLDIPASTTLECAGRGITTIHLTDGADAPVIKNVHYSGAKWGANPDNDITIRNCTIDGNGANNTGSDENGYSGGIILINVYDILIENVELYDVRGEGSIFINGNPNRGYHRGKLNNIWIRNTQKVSGLYGWGIYLSSPWLEDFEMNNVNVSGSENGGVFIEDSVQKVTINNLNSSHNKGSGISMTDVSDIYISNSVFEDNTRGINISQTSHDISIKGSLIASSSLDGILFNPTIDETRVIITDNRIIDNGTSTPSAGINLDTTTHNKIENNYFIENSGYGITEVAGADYNKISNNYFYNNEVGTWSLVGVHNQISGNKTEEADEGLFHIEGINGAGASTTMSIIQNGNGKALTIFASTTEEGLYIYSDVGALVNKPLVSVITSSSSFDQDIVSISGGTASGKAMLKIDDNNLTDYSIFIDGEQTTGAAFKIDMDAMTSGWAFDLRTDSPSFTGKLFSLWNTQNTSGVIAQFIQEGTGNNLFIDTNGNAQSINIDSESTSATVINVTAANTSGNIMNIASKLILDYNGNLGVGTTSPSQKLSVSGNVLADGYLEYSPMYEGSALEKIINIKSEKNSRKGDWAKVDHTTLPEGIYYEEKYVDKQTGKEETFIGRNLGNLVQLIQKGVKELYEICVNLTGRVEKLEEENKLLITELCKKDNSYAFCKEVRYENKPEVKEKTSSKFVNFYKNGISKIKNIFKK